jgi:hypothetical protein
MGQICSRCGESWSLYTSPSNIVRVHFYECANGHRWDEPVDDLQEPIANPERVDNGCMIFRSISGATATEGDK